MGKIIRWSTPTFLFTFSDINASDITAAYMTVNQNGVVIVEKTLSDATIIDGKLSFTLTQQDSALLSVNTPAVVRMDWKLSDGTRGSAEEFVAGVRNGSKDEVI